MSVHRKYNQKDATFSRSIYLYKLLYMIQAVPPLIIRSTKLYIQRQGLSNQYCCLLQFCAPDDGRRSHPKHVKQFIEINRSRKRCILFVVLYIYIDLDNQPIIFIIILLIFAKYFNEKYRIETYFIINFDKIMTMFNVSYIS